MHEEQATEPDPRRATQESEPCQQGTLPVTWASARLLGFRISVRTSSAFKRTSDTSISCVNLETELKVFDRRQLTLDGRRQQCLGGERVRCVLEHAAHVDHIITTVLEKNRHSTTYPEVYPGAKLPQISRSNETATVLYQSSRPTPKIRETPRLPPSLDPATEHQDERRAGYGD